MHRPTTVKHGTEFIVARHEFGLRTKSNHVDSFDLPRSGVIILSEFQSTSRVLGGALVINPRKEHEVLLVSLLDVL